MLKCIVGMLAPPAILSAFTGAMSSREDLVHCPLLQEQTRVVRCLSSLAVQVACRRQADISDKVRVATLGLEHSWDSYGTDEVTHTVFCTCTKNVEVIPLACRTDRIAKAAKLYAFSPSLIREVSSKYQPLRKALLIVTVILK